MASRKEQKQRARAARIVAEQAAQAAAARSRRLGVFVGIVVVAVAVIAVVVASSVGGGNTGRQSRTKAIKTYREVAQLLAGIPQHRVRLGNRDASVTMTRAALRGPRTSGQPDRHHWSVRGVRRRGVQIRFRGGLGWAGVLAAACRWCWRGLRCR